MRFTEKPLKKINILNLDVQDEPYLPKDIAFEQVNGIGVSAVSP
jgi:hypothetical protein